MMRMLAPLAGMCGRQLEVPLSIPLDARVETASPSALRVCA
jgi:hypothetical protein